MTEREPERDVYVPPEAMALARRLVDHRLRMELRFNRYFVLAWLGSSMLSAYLSHVWPSRLAAVGLAIIAGLGAMVAIKLTEPAPPIPKEPQA